MLRSLLPLGLFFLLALVFPFLPLGERAEYLLQIAFFTLVAGVLVVAGLGYVANTLRFWNITDETCEEVNRAWKVFLWLNYLAGAIVTISLVSVFLD